MAMAADSSPDHPPPVPPTSQPPHGPEFSGGDGSAADGPKLRRGNLSSPWTQIVRGESESIPVIHQSQLPPSSSLVMPVLEQTISENCYTPKAAASAAPSSPPQINSLVAESSIANNNNHSIAASPKKVAWNKPSNGIVEVGSVMDADSWPALSESTKASPKPSADSSSRPSTDGSNSDSQGPLTTNSPKKQANSSANPNATTNLVFAARQRHSRRGGGSGASHGSFPRHSLSPPPPPPPPLYPVYQMPPPNVYGNLIPPVLEPSPRDPSYRGNHSRPVGGFLSQQRAAHDHRNLSRRGNLGPSYHGDGAYSNSHGSRRDQERGNHVNARDTHMQPQRAPPRGFVRPPPPNTTAFVPPPPMRPFPHPVGYQEFIYVPPLPYEPIRGVMPFISHAPNPGMLIPAAEPLPTLIVNQIDYYFSDANLIKDEFLRSNMDDQGWIPISLIANFPRGFISATTLLFGSIIIGMVKNLTHSVELILSSLRASTVVEVQDDKVRRRSEWMKWLPTSSRSSIEPGSVSPGNSNSDSLCSSLEKITMEEPAASHKSIASKTDSMPEVGSESCYPESTTQLELPNGDITQNEHSS